MLYAFNTIAFGLLCFAWRTDSWVNLFLKVVLFGLAASNGLYLAQHLGWLVKV